ncbi:hypothetical protein A2U01_0072096, partial [Trifolium medium]|nr:hypothetical protein [Trifolium medium]
GVQGLRQKLRRIRWKEIMEHHVCGTENVVQEILHWLVELQHVVVRIRYRLLAEMKGEAIHLG